MVDIMGEGLVATVLVGKLDWIYKCEFDFYLACLHPPQRPTRVTVCLSTGKARHGACLEYTQNIALQHQVENLMGKPSLICSTSLTAMSLRGLRRDLPPAD
ncbi:hypothetical protein TNCV_418601 [Trichonephila clavipes]|nr:hypothetical protein TNCV_418601 [Trichonephila clavipes]